jgi:signal transduction histidine kinase
MSRVRNGLRWAALAGVLLLVAVSSAAAQTVPQILLLQSFNRGNLTLDSFTASFRVELDRLAGSPMNVVEVVVGPTGFIGASEPAVVDYIRSIFAGTRGPDLIVTVAGPAAAFARNYREQLFPDAPLVFAAVDQRTLRVSPLGDNDAAVAVDNDFPGLVDDILDLLPQTREVFVVVGSGPTAEFWRQELTDQFRRFRDRLTFVWSTDFSLPEMLRRCASLPRNSVIVFLNFGMDAQGRTYADERVFEALRDTANAPVFGVQSVMLGHGIVGGRLMAIDDLGRSAADVAIRLVRGAPPRSINMPPQSPGRPVFDWRELQRWNITENRLPPNSVVQYRSRTLWQEHRLTILGTVGVLIVQALLILGLLHQRRARRRAESDSRRSLALAAATSRRETMSALTNSIAHELGQPLSSMMHNATALQLMVAANRATPDMIGEILADIRNQGIHATQVIDRHRTMLRTRQLDKAPIELQTVINESLALVAHDMKARQVEATLALPEDPCIISGDHVLLQQVLVNLLINAMDAMVETPPARRHVTIEADSKLDDVEISVRDTGPGVPADVADTLFRPFVTTKSHGMGMGLTIAQTIIHAHGGTIEARNNPEGGATFAVTLRRSETLEIAPGPSGAA